MEDDSVVSDVLSMSDMQSQSGQMSLFDEEMIFADDPNKAYFDFMVGIDQLEDSLIGDSTLEDTNAREPSRNVQKKWLQMAGNKETPADDGTNNSSDDEDPKGGQAEKQGGGGKGPPPPVIYVGEEVGTSISLKKKEQALKAAKKPAIASGSFLSKNRRRIIFASLLIFLSMVGLIVGLLVSNGDQIFGSDKSTDPVQGTGDFPSLSPTPISTFPSASPMAASKPYPPTEDGEATVAPTSVPTETQIPSGLLQLISYLSTFSPDGGATLLDLRSPQFQAALWLSEDKDLQLYSNQQVLQRYTLATLYYSTNGEQWTTSDLWLSNEHECYWYNEGEFVCGTNTSSLQELYLPLNNLQGSLPLELALLSTLAEIDLTDNNLSGGIPTAMGQLTALERLRLKGNVNLGGSLPSEMFQLTAMTALALGSCGVGGSLPSQFGFLTTLAFLGLERNSFSGSIPTEFGSMTSLVNLALDYNQLIGTVPAQMVQLPNLEKLAVNNNSLTGQISGDQCSILDLTADCDEVACQCCTECCYDGSGCF